MASVTINLVRDNGTQISATATVDDATINDTAATLAALISSGVSAPAVA